MYLLTETERDFVRDILNGLVEITDPSECVEEEVGQAVEILSSLKHITNEQLMKIMENTHDRTS